MRVIYDFGSHNGDDITYYLKKAERVVAVEADPELASAIRRRFASEVEAGRLLIETTSSPRGQAERCRFTFTRDTAC